MQLIVIRHARPHRVDAESNEAADPELTELGHEQAGLLAHWLSSEPIDAIYVSPMRRARQTSEPIEARFGIEAVVDERLREYDHDAPQYVPLEELRANRESFGSFLEDQSRRDLTNFVSTVNSSLNEIIQRHPGQNVAVVCHGGVINAAASTVLNLNNTMFFTPHYTSLNRILASRSGPRSIDSLNDIGHLRNRPDLILT